MTGSSMMSPGDTTGDNPEGQPAVDDNSLTAVGVDYQSAVDPSGANSTTATAQQVTANGIVPGDNIADTVDSTETNSKQNNDMKILEVEINQRAKMMASTIKAVDSLIEDFPDSRKAEVEYERELEELQRENDLAAVELADRAAKANVVSRLLQDCILNVSREIVESERDAKH
eukprot:Lankesteria_metandrocarpae@DN5471_c1_g1_i13.p2